MGKQFYVLLALVVLATANPVDASLVRTTPEVYGTIWYDSTPWDFPKGGIGVLGHYAYGVAEYSVMSITTTPFYSLELSPRGIWSGVSVSKYISVFAYEGDGFITLDDYEAGSLIGTVAINPNDPTGAWYAPNDIGGFRGDSYLDITNLVNDARSMGWDYIGFGFAKADAELTGLTLRPTAILGSDSPLSQVPLPASGWLLFSGIGAIAYLNRRRFGT